MINGQTGTVTGKVPLSWWKITLLALLVAAIAVGIAYLISSGQRP